VHGLEDTVVPPMQAKVMAKALERRGVRHVFEASIVVKPEAAIPSQ
jgi:hypothetical protein